MSFGEKLRQEITSHKITPFIGVYDVFSATVTAQHYRSLFISGYSFAASFYGLPDIGFISWSDMVAFVQRARTVLPDHHLLVDIDDGYADTEVACHVVSLLESVGASGAVLEDQKRPRRCGHFDGKQILDLDDYLEKLKAVLATRTDLYVVARTDVSDPEEVWKRAVAFSEAGADAILVEAIRDMKFIAELKKKIPQPLMFNQLAGGKSPSLSLDELADSGISLVLYSTPCLFAAQEAVDNFLVKLKENNGVLPSAGSTDLTTCSLFLNNNLNRRKMAKQRFQVQSAAGRTQTARALHADADALAEAASCKGTDPEGEVVLIRFDDPEQ